jgi:hypothetical protein
MAIFQVKGKTAFLHSLSQLIMLWFEIIYSNVPVVNFPIMMLNVTTELFLMNGAWEPRV